ncbi:MAG: hypothetical protein H7A43_01505 [Verrucomicrobia bacterium]|nr:hypothetical protein [Kiritimatiellia bacterium]MCB1101195.1 hypothetical protein [Kiritimatiellia bacterium]MCP5487301.1 hypothetical protein [Verrucomicrobiota bacterium]
MNGDHGIAVGCVGRVGLAVGWLLLVLGCGQGPDLINEELPTRPVTIGDMVMKRHTAEDPRTNAIQSEVRRKVVEETFRVPLIFANPVAQVAFETQFYFIKDIFRQPKIGTLLPVKKINGELLWANISVVRSNYIEILSNDRIMTLDKQDLSPETQALLYTNYFAASFAKQRVEEAAATGILPTTNLPIRTYRGTNAMADRILIDDIGEISMGPGITFVTKESSLLLRGTKLKALEHYNDWVLVEHPVTPGVPYGWIPWFSTMSARGEDLSGYYQDVSYLIESGLVISVDPAQRKVWVNTTVWDSTMAYSLEGICRTLADYTRLKIGGKSTRIDVIGVETGKRLANYNRIHGVKRFE